MSENEKINENIDDVTSEEYHPSKRFEKDKRDIEEIFNKGFNPWKITSVVLAVLLGIALLTGGFTEFKWGEEAITGLVTSGDVGVKIIVLSDNRCNECEDISEAVLEQLEVLFDNVKVEKIDFGDTKGKDLYTKHELEFLPAFLFESNVVDEEGFSTVQNFLVDKNGLLELRIGSTFDPNLDCENPKYANNLECNPDAFVDCAKEFGISEDTIIFYYSDSCPWCTMMKPGVETLKKEGYSIISSDSTSAEDNKLIDRCFRSEMTGGVPQFICLKKNLVRPGAFADANRNMDLDAMRNWIDSCIE